MSIKSFLITAAVTCSAILITDFASVSHALDGRQSGVTCDSHLTLYDYCPNVIHASYMDPADRVFPVMNYIGSDKTSVYPPGTAKPVASAGSPTVYLIGDSFIQARSLYIDERFEHILRQGGYDVVARGYSSWNTSQYLNIVKDAALKSGDHVFVFSMTNDYTPNYDASTIARPWREVADTAAEPDNRSFLRKYWHASLLRTLADKIIVKNRSASGGGKHWSLSVSQNKANMHDCKAVPDDPELSKKITTDYIYLAKSSECWSQQVKDSVDLNVSLLTEMRSIVESKGAHLHILILPAGWAFPNQNSIGRNMDIYSVPMGISVEEAGLSQYLTDNGLPNTDLVDVLAPHAGKKDELYFPVDGHWTAAAHKVIGGYLLSVLKNEQADRR